MFLLAVLHAEKIGYVNTFEIRTQLKEYQEAEETLKKETSEWESKAREMKKEIEDMKIEVEKKRLLLNPQKVKEYDLQVQEKQMVYQQYLNEIWGENGKIFQREKELTKPITDRILSVIKDVAVEQKYTMVFDVYQANVVYAQQETNLTQEVIKKLTQKLE